MRLAGDEFEDDEQREHGFDHTGSGERGDDGLERAGHEVDDRVDDAFLFGWLAVASFFEVDFLFDFLEDVGDVGADDDLVDAGVDHDFGDAVHRFERFCVGFRFVFELEAKPGLTVIHIVDVFFSADFFNDLFGELGVLFRHNFFLSLLTPIKYQRKTAEKTDAGTLKTLFYENGFSAVFWRNFAKKKRQSFFEIGVFEAPLFELSCAALTVRVVFFVLSFKDRREQDVEQVVERLLGREIGHFGVEALTRAHGQDRVGALAQQVVAPACDADERDVVFA